MTHVLDYRPQREDSLWSQVKRWLVSPLSSAIRRGTIAASIAIIWGAAWLPGAREVELAGWASLGALALYGLTRRTMRGFVRALCEMPELFRPVTECYGRWQRVVVFLAATAPILNWPLRVNLFLQRPLLDAFGWYCYAQAPMLDPPATPRMVGLIMVDRIGADPNGVGLFVRGGGVLRYDVDPDRAIRRLYSCGSPPAWLLPASGRWIAFPPRW